MEFFGVKGIRICGEAIGGANYIAPYAFEPQWRSGEAIREDAAFAAHVVNGFTIYYEKRGCFDTASYSNLNLCTLIEYLVKI